jgi:hypothetical protein
MFWPQAGHENLNSLIEFPVHWTLKHIAWIPPQQKNAVRQNNRRFIALTLE